MNPDTLSPLELFAPSLFVLGAIYLLGPALPLAQGWARHVIFAAVWIVVARYLDWRLFTTVLPADGAWYEVGWVWSCFAIELLALADQLLLYLTFLRTGDRRLEADDHERRLRALPADRMPSVDVYIPTYNEPIDVLEKTITGALCLDYPNFGVWVLDDGRRPWLKSFCEAKGAGYLTRPDNKHAKAGNINHALTRTAADFVAVFDADFVPQRNFLMRTMGFFQAPEIGIVQVPHAFYNNDPMQANLTLRKSMPDEQRFFFEAIMPCRDGWNAAFCCGSNSVTRRAALRAIGDALPTQSITEDMLLTLVMLREGFVTRYLCERLAFGLAPESIDAFFVQRQRWARGAIQILYLADGPLGRKLALMQRLLFLPTHWLSLGTRSAMAVIVPIMLLFTGLSPVVNVTTASLAYYFLPVVLAVAGGIWVYVPGQQFPLAAQVLGVFQSFRLLPTVLSTLIKPHGHLFSVTPKGSHARASSYDRSIFWGAAGMIVLTVAGLMLNMAPEWRVVDQPAILPVVAIWSTVNVVVLFLVCMMALQAPIRRGEERFEIDEPIWIIGPGGALSSGRIKDISLSGVGIIADRTRAPAARTGDPLRVFIPEVGFVVGTAVRQVGELLGVQFDLPPSIERDLLIRKLFTAGLDTTNVAASVLSATGAMLMSIWSTRAEVPAGAPSQPDETAVEKLPACSLVIPPQARRERWADLVEQRRAMAA